LWFATPDNGLAAVFYNACDVTARVGDGTEVTIEQGTHYPFDERIEFTVKASKDVEFPLYLRVPGWCDAAKVLVNGELVHVHAEPLQFIKLDRRWSDGDRVSLTLPMEITLRQWDKNQDSISVDRGPLTYSLKIGEKYVKEGGTEEWPAWEIHPTTDWNYGLIVDQQDPASSLEVVEKEWPSSDMPFTIDNVPLELVGKGKQIPEWELDHLGMVGALQASPVRVEGPEVPLTLIPMGAARLRISAFPVIGSGPDAKKWQAPPKPLDYNPTSSHCWGADTVTAVCDRVSPVSSGDGSIPRLTFWDHRGTEEWVQYRFDEPTTIDHVEVYWFDDSERGNCRPPASWQVLHLRDGKWVPVETSDHFAVETNKFNRVTFKPVTTTSLRLSIQLQPQWSGGILEWRID
jgi:hypothetical protein